MTEWFTEPSVPGRNEAKLSACLLGVVDFEAAYQWQQRQVFEVSGDPMSGILLLCEHRPILTVGREGSRDHIRWTDQKLESLQWPIRWVARGGGVMLHVPGQLVCYPIVSLTHLGLNATQFRDALVTALQELVQSFEIPIDEVSTGPILTIRGRPVASVGLAIRQDVTSFGCVINVNPDLELYQGIACEGDERPMTSLQRECPVRVRPTLVRQRFLEYLSCGLGYNNWVLHQSHPLLSSRPIYHASTPDSV